MEEWRYSKGMEYADYSGLGTRLSWGEEWTRERSGLTKTPGLSKVTMKYK